MNYKKLLIYIAEGLSFLGITEKVNREENYISFKLKNSNKHFTIKINSDNELKVYMREGNIETKSFNIDGSSKFSLLKKIKNLINKERR